MPKQKKRKSVKKSIYYRLSLILIFLGIVLITIPSLFYLNQSVQLRFNTPTPSTNLVTKPLHRNAVPTGISISAIKTTLPVGETSISNNTWGIYNDGISHLDISARPGEKGAIILYGHNTKDRLGSLPFLKKGKQIIITTSDNKTYTYTVTETKEVSPDRMDVFDQQDEALIIYTCSGFADLKRFVVIAVPKK